MAAPAANRLVPRGRTWSDGQHDAYDVIVGYEHAGWLRRDGNGTYMAGLAAKPPMRGRWPRRENAARAVEAAHNETREK